MSRNTGSRWCLKDTEELLGYAPVDDAQVDIKYWADQKQKNKSKKHT
jgi:hypothetical protein